MRQRSVLEALDMCLAPAAYGGDMPTGNSDRVAGATCTLRKAFELGVHHPSLLRPQDGRAHPVAVEGLFNRLLRQLQPKVKSRR